MPYHNPRPHEVNWNHLATEAALQRPTVFLLISGFGWLDWICLTTTHILQDISGFGFQLVWYATVSQLYQSDLKCIPNTIVIFCDARWTRIQSYINGLVQDCSNSIAKALELLQSCTKQSILSQVLIDVQASFTTSPSVVTTLSRNEG